MKTIYIYTDGACSGNPGPGGWGALLRYNSHEKEISGAEINTTNNRMELIAAIEGLRALKDSCHVILTTDSEYLRQGITQWVHQWQQRNWLTAGKKPVKNKDLWQLLIVEEARHKVEWHWVRGHDGHLENERADKLAREAIEKLLKA